MSFDLGYDDVYMTWGCSFLENWSPANAGRLRAAVLGNYQVRSYETGEWVWAKKAWLEQRYDHRGSYNYGTEDGKIWMITTGISGLCKNPAPGSYSLKPKEW